MSLTTQNGCRTVTAPGSIWGPLATRLKKAKEPARVRVCDGPPHLRGFLFMQKLIDALQRRILILDGAMGTMIQRYKLDEKAYCGAQFANHSRDLKGAADVLNL